MSQKRYDIYDIETDERIESTFDSKLAEQYESEGGYYFVERFI